MDTTLPESLSVYNILGSTTVWNQTLTTNTYIASKSVTAMVDELSGLPNSLTVGATSNVHVNAVNAINMSAPLGIFYNYPTVGADGHTVTEDMFLKTFLSQDTTQTRMEATGKNMSMSFSNQMYMNSFYVTSPSTGTFDTIGTSKSGLVVKNNTTFSSNVAITGNSITYGSVFGQNFNLWTDKTVTADPHDLNKVGYGFRINSNDQLELIKMSYFNDDSVANKRIAVFGMTDNAYGCNDSSSNYLVFNALNVASPVSTAQNGNLITSASPLDEFIYMNGSNVGIGTTSAEYGLDVRTSARFTSSVALQGGFSFSGSLVPTSAFSSDLGSSSIKMKSIYCSSNLNIGNVNLFNHAYDDVLHVTDASGDDTDLVVRDVTAHTITASNAMLANANISTLYVETCVVAPGQDYAEFMRKSDVSMDYAPGQVIGIDIKGELTHKFSDSVHFKVVSSAPSIIGGCQDLSSEEFIASHHKIAYCGRVPVNTTTVPTMIGNYIVPVQAPDGSIATLDIEPANMTLQQYMCSVGQVISMSNDVPTIIVR